MRYVGRGAHRRQAILRSSAIVEHEVDKSGKHISPTLNIVSTGNHNHFAICSLFIIADGKVFFTTHSARTHPHEINCNVLHNARCKLHVHSAHEASAWHIGAQTTRLLNRKQFCILVAGGAIHSFNSPCTATTHQTQFPLRTFEGDYLVHFMFLKFTRSSFECLSLRCSAVGDLTATTTIRAQRRGQHNTLVDIGTEQHLYSALHLNVKRCTRPIQMKFVTAQVHCTVHSVHHIHCIYYICVTRRSVC